MSVTNGERLVTKQDLKDFYDGILPYIGGVGDINDIGNVDADNPSNGDVLQYNSTSGQWENGTGGGSSATVLSETLAASDTTVTFTSIPTTGNNLIDFFSSDGSNYISIDTSVSGSITLTYEAKGSARTIYCRIEGV